MLKVVRALGLRGLQDMATDPFTPPNPNYSGLAGRALGEQQLQNLPTGGVASIQDQCIPLPRRRLAGATWVPLLWIHVHQAGDHQLQVVVAGAGRPFGYRWDPPEDGPAGAGDHDYWHVQPITAVRTAHSGDLSFGVVNGDVCTQIPTLPIDAADQLHMFDALCVSLYGPRWLIDFTVDATLRQEIEQATRDRSWTKCRPPAAKAAVKDGASATNAKRKKR